MDRLDLRQLPWVRRLATSPTAVEQRALMRFRWLPFAAGAQIRLGLLTTARPLIVVIHHVRDPPRTPPLFKLMQDRRHSRHSSVPGNTASEAPGVPPDRSVYITTCRSMVHRASWAMKTCALELLNC